LDIEAVKEKSASGATHMEK